jgi:hypothetical protein
MVNTYTLHILHANTIHRIHDIVPSIWMKKKTKKRVKNSGERGGTKRAWIRGENVDVISPHVERQRKRVVTRASVASICSVERGCQPSTPWKDRLLQTRVWLTRVITLLLQGRENSPGHVRTETFVEYDVVRVFPRYDGLPSQDHVIEFGLTASRHRIRTSCPTIDALLCTDTLWTWFCF